MNQLAVIEDQAIELVEGEVVQIIEIPRAAGRESAAALYLERMTSPASLRTMRVALEVIASILNDGEPCDIFSYPWGQLTAKQTARVRTELNARYAGKPASANQRLAALRGVLKEAWRDHQMTTEEYGRASDIDSISGKSEPAGRALESGEIRSLFEACAKDGTTLGSRDSSLLAVLFGAGLRRSEAAGLQLKDYDEESGKIAVHHGKGNKFRYVYAPSGSRAALSAWIAKRGAWEGSLFAPVLKGGHVAQRGITDEAIRYALKQRGLAAAIGSYSAHDLRRTYISTMLEIGEDISTVQQLVGHSDIKTTALYDRRPEATKQKAAERLHVPFAG